MKIIEHRALRGPNHFSPYPTIYMLVDIEELERTSSERIPGFNDRLVRLLPGLVEHRCSPGHRGGFVERLERGTWAAHIVEHVALELQTAAGMEVGFGKTRVTGRKGVYSVVYRYRDEEAGLQAGRDAVNLVEAVAHGRAVDVAHLLARLRGLHEANAFGPSTGSIVAEARRRGIPILRLDRGSYVQLGHGARQQRIQATMTSRTSSIGVDIADDKQRTKRILADAGVPVPAGDVVDTLDEALDVAARVGYPIVLKPLVGNHGRGITTRVETVEGVGAAFDFASQVHPRVIVERHLEGADFRLLVVGHRLVAAARRDPAQVVGDGLRSVRQLVDALNDDPRRGRGHERTLTVVEVDADTVLMLQRQGLDAEGVPDEGRVVVLKSTANLSSGGTATDVTDEVHPAVRAMAERITRLVGLDVCGIDVVAPTLRRPLAETGGGVVEVNAAPGFRMHLEPSQGRARDVAGPVLDMLFPDGATGRIPIVAVTGTNGKTTTVRLVSHILRTHGQRVGMTTTSGVEVNGQSVLEGDYSGPAGAQAVLREPTVDVAVLEVARGGILRRGLGFDECDVGIFLNVASDHLGEGEIETLQDLARLKGVVVESVRRDGVAVLNAEDEHVAAFRDHVRARSTLFSLDPDHPLLLQHLEDGGVGVTLSHGNVVLRQGSSEVAITPVRDVPTTLDGRARFNVQNVLAAVAAAHALGVPDEVICAGLVTFNPTVAQLPGRMNVLDVRDFRVVIDYGHNAAALRALSDVLPHLTHGKRINVASAAGNRRDEDLRAFGETLAGMYHHVILCDPDPRDREPGETPEVVREGLRRAGFPEERVELTLDEPAAIDAALGMARAGDLVVLQVDDVRAAIERVRTWQGGAPLAPAPSRSVAEKGAVEAQKGS